MKFPERTFIGNIFDRIQGVVTSHVESDEHAIETTTFILSFMNASGSGYAFDCDSAGVVDVEKLNPAARENYERAILLDWHSIAVTPYMSVDFLCGCGSGKRTSYQHDARGIYIGRFCDDCAEHELGKYRTDVLTDSHYTTDEPIEEEVG